MSIDALRNAVAGDVLVPGDEGYLESARVAKRTGSPRAVVRPRDAADVAAAVRHATAEGLPLAVKSGGHDSRGYSTNDDGLVIDLGSIAGVELLGDDLVRLGSGSTWGAVAAALAPHGLAISSGDTKTVGVGGLALGGGVGWMVRAWGLAIDSLVEAEVVLATGEIVVANAVAHPDLFWALRGGGGNFGVVTLFTFRARPLEGVVSGAVELARDADLAVVFRLWRDAMREAPEQLTVTYLGLPSMGEGMPPTSQLTFVWAGTEVEAARAAIAPLVAIPGVANHTIDPMPYADVLVDEQPDADAVGAAQIQLVDNNGFAADFADALIDELAAVQRELGETVLMVRILGGAFARVPRDATAWAFRDTEAWIMSAAFFPAPLYDDGAARVRRLWARLDGWLTGMYGNFSSLDDPTATMYPPATLAWLRQIKRRYDPHNLFRYNHNIPPRAGA